MILSQEGLEERYSLTEQANIQISYKNASNTIVTVVSNMPNNFVFSSKCGPRKL